MIELACLIGMIIGCGIWFTIEAIFKKNPMDEYYKMQAEYIKNPPPKTETQIQTEKAIAKLYKVTSAEGRLFREIERGVYGDDRDKRSNELLMRLMRTPDKKTTNETHPSQ